MDDEVLTKEETEMIKRSFNVMDLNGDGRISVSELVKICKQLKVNISYEEAHKVLKEVDQNGDGYLDFSEYYNMMKDHLEAKKIEDKYLQEIFNKMDTNNDGYITVDELILTMKLSTNEAEELIKEADKDKDGKINFEEFVEGYRGKGT